MVFVHGDLEVEGGSTLADASVDVVIASNILFQIQEKSQFLREAKRVLRTHGRMLVVDWNDSYGGLGPQSEYVLTSAQARTLAEEEGFSCIATIDAGEYHYGLVFRK
jgi:ubiquinone/menaquinone biosynthesis C-methylase UbiE